MNKKYISQLTFLIALTLGALFYLFSQNPSITDENDLIENLQVLVLLLGGLAAFASAFTLVTNELNNGTSRKIMGYGFAILALSFAIRELDFRGSEGFEYLVPWTSSAGSRWLTLFLWIPFFIYISLNWSAFKVTVQTYWRSEHFWKMTIVVAILVVSDLVEIGVIPLTPTVFYEESLELVAYALFAWNLLKIKTLRFRGV